MRELLFFVASSFWAGAAHAATPGHGKTIAAAYIVGARGKPIDAVILGIFVTLSHTSGIVLVGGSAQLQGIRRLAGEVFTTSVRIGTPTGMFGLVESISNPAFAASVGLLKWGLTQADEYGVPVQSLEMK